MVVSSKQKLERKIKEKKKKEKKERKEKIFTSLEIRKGNEKGKGRMYNKIVNEVE